MDNFVNRLEFLLENLDYTASAFADKIGVQRSSLSHLLSGRNKPSLDFILKVDEAFPELNLKWLLKGEGHYLESENKNYTIQSTPKTSPISNSAPTLFSNQNETKSESDVIKNTPDENQNTGKASQLENQDSFRIANDLSDSDVEQIIIFYKDGSFRQFKPK
ncbi:helix-turn-helix transcriptional regulator [Myroides injenensis]|uniref:helix-turn-helix transcriptional regulator n=1 Tax=Myroides injenensis TaxID=1183151 RepID=UPI000287D846|nr:helix-turn-helix transcriptional regulator [Myroides injenensis]